MTWKTGSPRLQDNDPGRQSSPLRPRAHVRTTGKPVKRCKKKGGLLGAPPHGSIPTEQTMMHPTPVSTLPFIQPGLEPKVARSSRSKSQDRVKKATRFANTRRGQRRRETLPSLGGTLLSRSDLFTRVTVNSRKTWMAELCEPNATSVRAPKH